MLILCKAWASSRRLCDVQNGVGVAFVSVRAAWVSILVLEKQDFSFFFLKGKKGHANFSSVFLEGNGRCVGLDSFFFSFLRLSPPTHPSHPPTQIWADDHSGPLIVCSCALGVKGANTVSALSRASCECERCKREQSGRIRLYFLFPAGISESLCSAWKLSRSKGRRFKSQRGFPVFWTAVSSSFKCKHTHARRMPHQHTPHDLCGQHSLFKHCLKV